MVSITGIILGAVLTATTAWIGKSQDVQWRLDQERLKGLEDLAELSDAVTRHYREQRLEWLKMLKGHDPTPFKDVIPVHRAPEVSRLAIRAGFHAQGLRQLCDSLKEQADWFNVYAT